MTDKLSHPAEEAAQARRFERDQTAKAEATLEAVYAVLRRDQDRFMSEIQATIRREMPDLEALTDEDLHGFIQIDYHRALEALSERRLPNADELEYTAQEAAECARLGFTIDQVTAARRLAARRTWELLREESVAREIDEATQMEGLYAMWEWADAMHASEAAARRRIEVELAGGDDDRSWFARALIHGTLPPADVHHRATAYGLLPGGRYMAFRARPRAGVGTPELSRAIAATGGEDGIGVLVTTVDGDVCGVTTRPPRAENLGIVGLGNEVELPTVDTSFRLATRALETAVAFGVEGVVRIEDLSLRPAVLAEKHLGERLVHRYLEPLRELGEFGTTLEETVRAYLEHGMRIDESAKSLFVHPNTLRHRIDRFQQLTSADLRRTEDVLELWWALERRRLDSSTDAHNGATNGASNNVRERLLGQ